ncbi:unnamed protein product [Prunus armeniaca]
MKLWGLKVIWFLGPYLEIIKTTLLLALAGKLDPSLKHFNKSYACAIELCGLARREKEAGIFSEPEVDIFMKATSMGGVESSLITDYTLREDCKLRDLVVKDGMEINNVIVNGKQKQPIISDDSNEAMKHAFELFNV